MVNGGRMSARNLIADEFCKYFTEIGPKLSSKITSESLDPNTAINNMASTGSDSLYLTPTYPLGIVRVIRSMKTKKFKGHDELHSS